MAMGGQPTDTNKPRYALPGRGAGEPGPTDANAPGIHRALLHVTMKHTAQPLTALFFCPVPPSYPSRGSRLPTALKGETQFNLEGLTDDVISLANNTLAAVTDTWDDAVGHPTERKDRVQEKEDTLTRELMDQLVQLTDPQEQRVP